MMKRSPIKTSMVVWLLTLMVFIQSCGKEENPILISGSGTRYKDIVFSEIVESVDVTYGANTDQAGNTVTLQMNIFEPANDTIDSRPLIILAHGGGFTEGAKEDFNELAQSMARAGFVAATIGYRLLNDPAGELQFAVVDAVQDMKAAVRFFTSTNTYQIDPENIFVGGFSAGAVTALHYAYFNDEDISTAPPGLADYLASSGGLSGNSGNAGASEKIKGVLSISGGLFTVDWISAGEPILYSIHGTNDTDVFCTKDPEAQTNPDGDFTEGACLIHPVLDQLGISNLFRQIEGGDHGAYFSCSDCDAEMRQFLFDNL